MMGLGLEALFSGLLAQFVHWPLHLSFIVYLIILFTLAALMWWPAETVSDQLTEFKRLPLRPRLGVPSGLRAEFFAPAATVFVSMALFGFCAALAPTILREGLQQRSHAVSGGIVFELCLVAALTVAATRGLSSRTGMLSGLALMLSSVGFLVCAQYTHSMSLLLLGTTSAGIAVALGYRGSLQLINQIAPSERRAEVVSSYLLAGFAGNSIPIIGVGVLTGVIGPLPASASFAVMVAYSHLRH